MGQYNRLALTIAFALITTWHASANQDDPFATEDPFESEPSFNNSDEPNNHQSRLELKGYYQDNSLRSPNRFNPGLKLFNQYNRAIGLDWSIDSQWSDSISSHGRLYSRYMVGSDNLDNGMPEGPQVEDRYGTYLLEGALHWQNQQQDLVISIGRIKPSWSHGYNYDIANILRPHGNLPYIDQDNPLQHKGWDMIQAQYFIGHFTLSGYLIESRLNHHNDNGSDHNINHEAVIRLGYQREHEFSFLIHKHDHGRASYAATFSTSLNDNSTIRAEWTAEPIRRVNYSNPSQLSDHKSRYQRIVIGANYTWLNSWSLTAELFYNQHGINDPLWQQIYTNSSYSAEQVNTGHSQDFAHDINQALQGIDFLAQGWTSKRYGSLMLMSPQSENLWQYRISTQMNLVDSSRLYRLEVLKSVNDNLSARLEYQQFDGCSSCEYGLNPYKNNFRLTASWLF